MVLRGKNLKKKQKKNIQFKKVLRWSEIEIEILKSKA